MRSVTQLRLEVRAKRQMADVVRRIGPTVSSTRDRDLLAQHAIELEAEAAGLECQATSLECARPV